MRVVWNHWLKLHAMVMAATAYLEKYFDCVDALPQDLQKHITELREIERHTQGLLAETCCVQEQLNEVLECDDKEEQKQCLAELRHCMLRFREFGDDKLERTSQLVDTAGYYSQQLTMKSKELENPRDDHHTPRYSYPSPHTTMKGDSPCTVSEVVPSSKRNSSSKRPRPSEKNHPPPLPIQSQDEEHHKEGAGLGRSRENSTTSTSGGVATGGIGKPPKKKMKVKKKSGKEKEKEKEKDVFLPPHGQVPMPDLSSQPIQPNEPTYCLCNQVSFGEMIGCDNEDCPIEWFHFQCVALTSKPKGKWYCPQCAQERKIKASK